MAGVKWFPLADSGWMWFPALTVSAGVKSSYTLGYRVRNSDELWTRRFNGFKANDDECVSGASRLLSGAVPKLIGALKVNPKDSIFISILSSKERKANPSRAIPRITRDCAAQLGIRYEVDALTKNQHQPIHNIFNADARDTELGKAQYQAMKLQARNVFVFDDLITRGATLSLAAQAILTSNPGVSVYGVALAKNDTVGYCQNPTNDQIPAQWDALWMEGVALAKAKKGK